jgi:hypothetical protein
MSYTFASLNPFGNLGYNFPNMNLCLTTCYRNDSKLGKKNYVQERIENGIVKLVLRCNKL